MANKPCSHNNNNNNNNNTNNNNHIHNNREMTAATVQLTCTRSAAVLRLTSR